MTRLGRLLPRAPALVALATCTAGGALCYALHTPLPWMTGSLVTMAVLKFSGLAVAAPRGGRETGQLLIATALGLYFTPTVAREVLARWELLVAAAVFATVLAYIGAWMLSRWADTDRTTALFASVPGGATEMMHLGERFGARPDRIAVAQRLRILLVVLQIVTQQVLLRRRQPICVGRLVLQAEIDEHAQHRGRQASPRRAGGLP